MSEPSDRERTADVNAPAKKKGGKRSLPEPVSARAAIQAADHQMGLVEDGVRVPVLPEMGGFSTRPPVAAEDGARGPASETMRARRRLAVLALCVVAALFVGVVATIPLWNSSGPGSPGATPSARSSALAWLASNAARSERVAVLPQMWSAVVAEGWVEADADVREPGTPIPADTQWVITSAGDASADGDSVVVASFGAGDAALQVRAVIPGGADAYRAAESERAEQRRRDGGELAENDALVVREADRALLRDGEVDARILVVLGGLSAAGPVVVDAFPLVAGEDDAPRRSVVLSAVGGRDLVQAGQLSPGGVDLVQSLSDAYTPNAVALSDDAVTLRYPVVLDGSAP